MLVELRQFVLLAAVGAGAFGACTRVESASPTLTVTLPEGGAAGETAGGAGSLAGDGGDGSAGEYVGAGGALGTIELGVWPTFAVDPKQSSDVQAVLASVTTLSIGASTLPISERWDQLSGATGSPRALTWNRLDAMTQPFRERGAGLALCIDIVEREQRAWPFSGELEGDGATAAIERTIDEAYTRYASHLSHLCFGYELDRYLAVASRDEQQRLVAFLKHAVDYASHHPLRAAATAIGTALSLGALSEPGTLDELALGDEVVAVYDPLDEAARLKSSKSVADELAAALASLAAAPGAKRQLTVFEVGYPSSADAGSTEQEQRAFYSALFGLLDTRRADVGFVGIYGLADRAAADCEAEALAFDAVSDADADQRLARATTRCSMGLRADRHKPASLEVMRALSRFR